MKAAIAVLLFVGSLVDAKCYLPDGTGATNPIWRECSTDLSDPLSNICCALNRTNPAGGLRSEGETAETCLPNGLCEQSSVSDSGNITTSYRRAYCTSQEWESGKCLTTCGKAESGFKTMTPCDGTSSSERWCCGTSTNCCNPDSNLGVVILAKKFLDAAPSTVTGSRTASSSSTPKTSSSSTPIPTPSTAPGTAAAGPAASQPQADAQGSPTSSAAPSESDPKESEGMTTGTKVGIAIGAVVGGAALLAVGAWLALSSQRKKKTGGDLPYGSQPSELDGSYSMDQKQPYLLQQTAVHEVPPQNRSYAGSTGSVHSYRSPAPVSELPEQQYVMELPAESAKPVKGRDW